MQHDIYYINSAYIAYYIYYNSNRLSAGAGTAGRRRENIAAGMGRFFPATRNPGRFAGLQTGFAGFLDPRTRLDLLPRPLGSGGK